MCTSFDAYQKQHFQEFTGSARKLIQCWQTFCLHHQKINRKQGVSKRPTAELKNDSHRNHCQSLIIASLSFTFWSSLSPQSSIIMADHQHHHHHHHPLSPCFIDYNPSSIIDQDFTPRPLEPMWRTSNFSTSTCLRWSSHRERQQIPGRLTWKISGLSMREVLLSTFTYYVLLCRFTYLIISYELLALVNIGNLRFLYGKNTTPDRVSWWDCRQLELSWFQGLGLETHSRNSVKTKGTRDHQNPLQKKYWSLVTSQGDVSSPPNTMVVFFSESISQQKSTYHASQTPQFRSDVTLAMVTWSLG